MASEREVIAHELTEKTDDLPWATTKLVEELGVHDYEDATIPPNLCDDMDLDIMDPDEELIPDATQFRIHRKRPAEATRAPQGQRLRTEVSDKPFPLPQSSGWVDLVSEHAWMAQPNPRWKDQNLAVEVSFELPNSAKAWEKFIRDPEQFFVRNLKRKTVEVSERRMSPEERASFDQAKQVEVRKYLAAKALEALPPDARPDA